MMMAVGLIECDYVITCLR